MLYGHFFNPTLLNTVSYLCVTDARSRRSSALHCTRIEKVAGHHTEGRHTVSKPYFSLQADLGEIWEWRTFWSHWDESLEMFFFSSWRERVSETVQGKVDFELNLETRGGSIHRVFSCSQGHTVPWTTRGLFSSVWSCQLSWRWWWNLLSGNAPLPLWLRSLCWRLVFLFRCLNKRPQIFVS